MSRKPAKKSTRKSTGGVTGKGFKPGEDPRRGRGPKKGAPNAGRPPDQHRKWCQAAISDPRCEKEVLAVLKDRTHGAFATMWKVVADRGYGRPTGSEVTFPVNPEHLTDDQLKRIAQGEDPLIVLATSRQGAGAT